MYTNFLQNMLFFDMLLGVSATERSVVGSNVHWDLKPMNGEMSAIKFPLLL